MFLLDLFSGVVFYQYGRELDQDSHLSALNCTQEQINWIMIQKLLRDVKPTFTFLKEPTNRVRKFFFRLTTRVWFENFMYIIIFIDIARLGLYFSDMPDYWENVLHYLNISFTALFIFEGLFFWIAHKKILFRNKWIFVEITVILFSKSI
jgi:hypothetical protein